LLEKIKIDKHIRAQNVPKLFIWVFFSEKNRLKCLEGIALFTMGGGILPSSGFGARILVQI